MAGQLRVDEITDEAGTGSPNFVNGVDATEFKASGTGANIMPVGTTAQRPASPVEGMFRLNTTTTEPEWYDEESGEWVAFRVEPDRTFTADFLVIAGGGSGGNGNANIRIYGGGGAGGYRTSAGTSGGNSAAETALSLDSATNYTVTVGAGGAASVVTNDYGRPGNNSAFATITSTGGGAGVGGSGDGTGGSGGGGGNDGTGVFTGKTGVSGQGSNGGAGDASTGGGGGGAGAVGGNGTGGTGAVGGAGIASSITGSSVTRAGGGGGGGTSSGGAGGAGGGTAGNSSTAAAANTGGGSGGTATAIGTGNGGSGVVIVKYPDTSTITNPGGGLTSSTASAGGFKVTTFTAGTGTIQFN